MTQDEIAPIRPDEGADDIAQRQMRGPALSRSADEAQLAARWRGQARALIFTFCGLLAALVAFVAIFNPFGNLPLRVLGPHVVMDINQRYQYPALIREGNFDSFVLGTSTSRLLEPDRLNEALDGRFINLALNSGRAWEQYRLGKLALRNVPSPRNVLIGLDVVWCYSDADQVRTTKRGFPEWMFDEDPWNDLPYMLNMRTVEISARRLAYHLGLIGSRVPSDGYEVFVPPESEYDAKKAARKIWKNKKKARLGQVGTYQVSEVERKSWRYPALDWLDRLLGLVPHSSNVMLTWMPVHIAAQPAPFSHKAAHEAECKARVAEIAARHGAHDVDFRILSDVTRRDENYWDRLHYRVPVATKIVEGLAEAVRTQQDSATGFWVYSAGPAR
jgi:hypothetical protein